MTVIAIGAGLVSRHFNKRREQIETLVAKGAQLTFSQPLNSLPRWKQGIARLFGENSVLEVSVVDFGSFFRAPAEIEDDDLAILSGLNNLSELHLAGTKITDAGLKHLAELDSLKSLNIDCGSITVDGILNLKHLPRLRFVYFGYLSKTDQAKLRSEMPKCVFQSSLQGIWLGEEAGRNSFQ